MAPEEKARAHLQKLIDGRQFPGIQYLVLDRSGTRLDFAGGRRDTGTHAKVTAETSFMAASSTKTVTALAVLQLVDQGKVGLDEPLSAYFKGHPYGNALTVRQLITHTAGVPNPMPLDWFHPAEDRALYDEKVVLAGVLEANPKLVSEPGKKYAYSNLGYWLLARVVEQAAGMPYTEYVEQQILDPLDIPRSELGFDIPDLDNHAAGYVKRFSAMRAMLWIMAPPFVMGEVQGEWLRFNTLLMNGPAYGGLIGTARGWRKLLADQLAEESRVMTPGVRELLYEVQLAGDGADIGMTLGWHTGELQGQSYLQKPGGGPGYSCNIRVYPDKGLASVWMNNRMEASEGPINKISNAIDEYFLR